MCCGHVSRRLEAAAAGIFYSVADNYYRLKVGAPLQPIFHEIECNNSK